MRGQDIPATDCDGKTQPQKDCGAGLGVVDLGNENDGELEMDGRFSGIACGVAGGGGGKA
jgi:hypothetical protein